MEKTRVWKVLTIVALVLSIVGIGIAFASNSTDLEINGTADVKKPEWNIKFENLGSAQVTGSGKEEETPNLSDTSISNIKAAFDAETGSISYEFDVKNYGVLDAKIGTLTMHNPQCTGTGSDQSKDENLVCKAISTSLVYANDNNEVKESDTLKSGETKRMKFTITYTKPSGSNANEVSVSDLGATIIYVEDVD